MNANHVIEHQTTNLPVPSRRRRNVAADTRESLINVAAHLFRVRGFGSVTIDEICAAVSPPLSKGAYYHSFDSKQAVLFAILEKYMLEAAEFVDALENSEGETAEQIEQLFLHSSEMLKTFRPYVVVSILEQRHLSGEYSTRVKQMRDGYRRKIERIIRRGQESGTIIGLNAKILTLNYFGILNWMYLWFEERGPLSADEVVAICHTQFLRSVLVHPDDVLVSAAGPRRVASRKRGIL